MYKIILVKRAIKDLAKLDGDVKERIKEKLKLLMIDPESNSKKLSNSLIGSYRLRVGDYRVIFDID
jgi:mRNA interferase RelE/StbE